MSKRRLFRRAGRGVRFTIGRSGRRLTISRHGVTISAGVRGSGLFSVWRRSWRQLLRDVARIWGRLRVSRQHSSRQLARKR